jgi:hypothetical protein
MTAPAGPATILRAAVHPGPVDRVCGQVMFELLGADQAEDDVALLMLVRPRRAPVAPKGLQARAEVNGAGPTRELRSNIPTAEGPP